ncbi:MAG: hypothetical protein JWP29_2005 [Rhodoferax sp.]|nr:hypothetical protein [Rhodoferax sp.]
MDTHQAAAFLEFMIGFKSIGVAGDEEITVPVCPEMRAFVVARLGENTPSYYNQMVRVPGQAAAMAGLLREVADQICPAS